MTNFQRPSKRTSDQLRSVTITRGFTKHAEGSVLIQFGDTHVLCTASILEKVPPHQRGSGEGWVTAEYSMLPGASPERCLSVTATSVVRSCDASAATSRPCCRRCTRWWTTGTSPTCPRRAPPRHEAWIAMQDGEVVAISKRAKQASFRSVSVGQDRQRLVGDDQLQCPYHGLRYNPAGRCTHMPAQRTVNPSAASP